MQISIWCIWYCLSRCWCQSGKHCSIYITSKHKMYQYQVGWPNGKALDYESRDCRFDPCVDQFDEPLLSLILLAFLAWYPPSFADLVMPSDLSYVIVGRVGLRFALLCGACVCAFCQLLNSLNSSRSNRSESLQRRQVLFADNIPQDYKTPCYIGSRC